MARPSERPYIVLLLAILIALLSPGSAVVLSFMPGGPASAAPAAAGPSADASEVSVAGNVMEMRVPLTFPHARLEESSCGTVISMEGIPTDVRQGALMLPRQAVPLTLPLGSDLLDVRFEVLQSEHLGPCGSIGRVPAAIPNADLTYWEPIATEPQIPEGRVSYRFGTGLDLDTMDHVARLSVFVHPVIPAAGGFDVALAGDLIITYETPSADERLLMGGPMADLYDLLVICPDQFLNGKNGMESYAQYRNATGIRTRVITLDMIRNDRIWEISGADLQEEMKYAIYNATLDWGIDYVLLAGDSNVMPVRFIMVLDGYDDDGLAGSDGRFVSSDLYFSDIFDDGTTTFSSWNSYKTGSHEFLWGEFDDVSMDDPDLYPDVLVGRMPAHDTVELARMINKVKGYELSALGSDWFMNATLCGTDTFGLGHGETSGVPEGEYMSELLNGTYFSVRGFEVTTHYETENTIAGIASTIDKGCGFFEMSDHGDYDGWGYVPGPSMTNTMAAGLDNGMELPVVVLDACLTSGFDNENASNAATGKDPVYNMWYYPPGSAYVNLDCLSEQFHKANNGGGIATFGCTRVGYGAFSTFYPVVNSGYMNGRIHKAYFDGYDSTGGMMAKAAEDYLSYIGVGDYADFKTVTEYILLGDPTVTVGGIPGAMINIDFEEASVGILPGENVTIGFHMNNTGFLGVNLTIGFGFADGAPGSWELWSNVTNATLGPDMEFHGEVSVKAPLSAVFGTGRELVVSASFALISNPRTARVGLIVERTWGVDLEPVERNLTAKQGGSVYGYFDIENLGNGPEVLDLSFPSLLPDWSVEVSQWNMTLTPFESDDMPFRLSMPEHIASGAYPLEMRAASRYGPSSDTVFYEVRIGQDHIIRVVPSVNGTDLHPEVQVSVPVTIENLGNGPVEVSTDQELIGYEGWDVSFSYQNITIAPFSSEELLLNVTAPNGTKPGIYEVRLGASDGTYWAESYVTMNITRVFAFRSACDDPVKQDDDGAASFNITLQNLGNYHDSYLLSPSMVAGKEWSVYIPKREVGLSAGESTELRIDVGALQPLTGTYQFSIKVQPRSATGPQFLYMSVMVPKRYDFDLEGSFFEESARPGQWVEGIFTISNLANCDDTFNVTVVPPGGWAFELNATDLDLGQGEVRDIFLKVMLPEDGLAGVYPVNLIVGSLGGGDEIQFPDTVRIEEVHDVEMAVDLPQKVLNVGPGDLVEIDLKLTNNGNTVDSYVIRTNGSDKYISGWVSVLSSSFDHVQVGENRSTRLRVLVPAMNVTGGSYTLKVMVASRSGDKEVSEEITLVVKGTSTPGELEENDYRTIGICLLAGVVILVIVIVILLWVRRKRSGADLEDLDLEWEEEEDWDDEEGEDEEDWE